MTTEPMTHPTRRDPNDATSSPTPSTYRAFAIISTVLFWPVGLFAIITSVATTNALARNDRDAARASSRTTKKLSIVATSVGVAGWLVSALVIILTLGLASGVAADGPYKGPGTASYDLAVGDCFSAPTSSMTPGVPPIDCAQPHTGEVYNTIQLKGGAYPNKETMIEAAVEACMGTALTDYVGADEAAAYTEHYLAPSEEFWNAGRHTLVCFLTPAEEDAEMTSSARKS